MISVTPSVPVALAVAELVSGLSEVDDGDGDEDEAKVTLPGSFSISWRPSSSNDEE